MNRISKILIPLLVAATPLANAALIEGTITFTGTVKLFDGVPATPTTSLNAADGVNDWDSVTNPPDATVETADGDFAGLAGSAVTITTPWFFTSGPVIPFWQVGGFTFEMTSSSINTQNQFFISAVSNGVIKKAGFDDTPGKWFFSTQGTANANGAFSFSADSMAIPDSGGTMAMLCVSLLAFAGFFKRYGR